MRAFEFWKMHGAGNDFVVVRGGEGRTWSAEEIREVCAWHLGVGADGFIVLSRGAGGGGGDARMEFFNPDGSAAGMCGNGARCAARAAWEWGWGGRTLELATGAGVHRAENLEGGAVRLWLPGGRREGRTVEVGGRSGTVWSVDTGVPHAVAAVTGLEGWDVEGEGRRIRRHGAFAPAGTNVDFAERGEDGTVRVRTYERGVEAETLACGTGVLATAAAAEAWGWVERGGRVAVRVRSGDALEVGLAPLTLTGPTRWVFSGRWGGGGGGYQAER